MNSYQFIAIASPLLLGFFLPYLLNVHKERQTLWSLRSITKSTLWVATPSIVILTALALLSDSPLISLVPLSLFLVAYSILIIMYFHFFASLRLNGSICQILTSLTVIVMMGSVFYANPLINQFEVLHSHPEAIIKIILAINPFIIIGGDILEIDPIKGGSGVLYNNSLLSFYKIQYPIWWHIALAYLGISIGLGGLNIFLRKCVTWLYERKSLLKTNTVQPDRS